MKRHIVLSTKTVKNALPEEIRKKHRGIYNDKRITLRRVKVVGPWWGFSPKATAKSIRSTFKGTDVTVKVVSTPRPAVLLYQKLLK